MKFSLKIKIQMCAHLPEYSTLVIKSHLNANVIIIYNKSTSIILAVVVLCVHIVLSSSFAPIPLHIYILLYKWIMQ